MSGGRNVGGGAWQGGEGRGGHSVLGLGDVHEEGDVVGAVVAAAVAAEGPLIAVEPHVDLVHHLDAQPLSAPHGGRKEARGEPRA